MCPDDYSDIQVREPANEFEPASRLHWTTLQLACPGGARSCPTDSKQLQATRNDT